MFSTCCWSHLGAGRQEGGADLVEVPAADLDAQTAAVHLDRVEGVVLGADVALAPERRHGDGVPLLGQRHVVAERPVQEQLRSQTTTISSRPSGTL